MFRYRVHTALGEEIGEATHGFLLSPGEKLRIRGRAVRVIRVVPVEKQGKDMLALLYVDGI